MHVSARLPCDRTANKTKQRWHTIPQLPDLHISDPLVFQAPAPALDSCDRDWMLLNRLSGSQATTVMANLALGGAVHKHMRPHLTTSALHFKGKTLVAST